ncbi:hypothetical protein [Dyadobacter psychrotolerans]|uniref:Type I restriction enzyme R protein N-terminal domain-containing protein n=1 Tax=Dyadobacter psychrotolerans TaxID=2541721 RepID=A0A4V2Z414_9BACT|nr:hypothetical protein [Dyadobacter psychrotolerans]TDE14778.1 hypothetical protein E0F88_16460 [Dyadobacter psychrotolerans]
MIELYIYDQKVQSLFFLLGQAENDISYSVAYAFSQSTSFLTLFLKEIGITAAIQEDQIRIRLQQYEHNQGYTDFEIIQPEDFHIIVEAKRGWVFPSDAQIDRYYSSLSYRHSKAAQKQLVIFNESTVAFTASNFNMTARCDLG